MAEYLNSFCQGAEESAIIDLVPRITKDLGPFLLMTSDDTLSLVLETLSVLLEVDKGSWLGTELAGSLLVALFDVWEKNNKGRLTSLTFGVSNRLHFHFQIRSSFQSLRISLRRSPQHPASTRQSSQKLCPG